MSIQRLIGIVDDDPDIPEALSSLLRSFGYRVACFGSAAELLTSVQLADFACIISDVHMPSVNGLELALRLRELMPQLPVILMTGRPEQGLKERAHACGARSCLAKPISVDALMTDLHQAIAGTE
jgi:FixJ family two-component response regulator